MTCTCTVCGTALTGGRDTFDIERRQFCALCRFEEEHRLVIARCEEDEHQEILRTDLWMAEATMAGLTS